MYFKEYRIKNNNFVKCPWELARIGIIKMLISKYYRKKNTNILDMGTENVFLGDKSILCLKNLEVLVKQKLQFMDFLSIL